MPAISNDWLAPLSQEFRKPYYKKLYDTLGKVHQSQFLLRIRAVYKVFHNLNF